MKNLILPLMLATSCSLIAQEEVPTFILGDQLNAANPAASGLFYSRSAYLFAKGAHVGPFRQYSSVAGYQQRSKAIHGGFGILNSLVHSEFGYTGDNFLFRTKGISTKLQYSYHISMKDGATLGLGLAAGFSRALISDQYPQIPETLSSRIDQINTDIGVMYKRNKWYVGISGQVPLLQRIEADSLFGFTKETVQLNLSAGYRFDLGDRLSLQPQVVIGNTSLSHLSLTATWNNKHWVTVSSNTPGAVGLGFGTEIGKRLRIGYGMHYYTRLQGVKVNHQLTLGFRF